MPQLRVSDSDDDPEFSPTSPLDDPPSVEMVDLAGQETAEEQQARMNAVIDEFEVERKSSEAQRVKLCRILERTEDQRVF